MVARLTGKLISCAEGLDFDEKSLAHPSSGRVQKGVNSSKTLQESLLAVSGGQLIDVGPMRLAVCLRTKQSDVRGCEATVTCCAAG